MNHREAETNEKKMRTWTRQSETSKKDEEMNQNKLKLLGKMQR